MLELVSVGYHPATAAAPVLRELNLRLPVGEPALVAGRSGSGKTTLLRLVMGLDRPDAGELHLDGECLSGAGRHVPAERPPCPWSFRSSRCSRTST